MDAFNRSSSLGALVPLVVVPLPALLADLFDSLSLGLTVLLLLLLLLAATLLGLLWDRLPTGTKDTSGFGTATCCTKSMLFIHSPSSLCSWPIATPAGGTPRLLPNSSVTSRYMFNRFTMASNPPTSIVIVPASPNSLKIRCINESSFSRRSASSPSSPS
uniref:(northern house mosquito) hypothetical protein n=1 Tax=Culex pipiens TaxID=7175 RepID=A0A8D8BH89_CULPI